MPTARAAVGNIRMPEGGLSSRARVQVARPIVGAGTRGKIRVPLGGGDGADAAQSAMAAAIAKMRNKGGIQKQSKTNFKRSASTAASQQASKRAKVGSAGASGRAVNDADGDASTNLASLTAAEPGLDHFTKDVDDPNASDNTGDTGAGSAGGTAPYTTPRSPSLDQPQSPALAMPAADDPAAERELVVYDDDF